MDRLARSLKQLIDTVEELKAKGIGFRSLTQSIDTSTPNGKVMFHFFAVIAEFERDMIRERTIAGLELARSSGRTGGRPIRLDKKGVATARAMLSANPEMTVAEVASRIGISPATLYRHLPAARHNAMSN
jgi:DNA invertase Pin-like site-specific DNA recombinase